MVDASTDFAGSIPRLYDRYLGPAMFEPYAADLARRVADRAGGAVLETACGTGILTRHLRARLPAAARLVATDLNRPMLDYARATLDGADRIAEAVAAALAEFGGAAPFRSPQRALVFTARAGCSAARVPCWLREWRPTSRRRARAGEGGR